MHDENQATASNVPVLSDEKRDFAHILDTLDDKTWCMAFESVEATLRSGGIASDDDVALSIADMITEIASDTTGKVRDPRKRKPHHTIFTRQDFVRGVDVVFVYADAWPVHPSFAENGGA